MPVVRLICQSYYDNTFYYIQVEDVTKEIARKHTYYNAADKTVEIQLNQDLINSIIKDNLDSLGIKISGGSIKDLKFNTEDQRLYVNIKYGIFKLPLSFAINVDYSEEGIKISASDVHLGKRNAPGFVKKQVPLDMISFEVNYEEMGIPNVFTMKEVLFRPGYVLVTAQLIPENIAALAIEQREVVVDEIGEFKKDQPTFLQTFIDRVMDAGVLSEDKIKEYVDSVLANEEVVNSAIHFAMADDLDKYTKGLDDCRKAIAEWASPLETIKLDGSVNEAIESIVYNEELKDLATWFVPSETINEYANTAESFYETFKESQTLALNGELELSIENLIYNDSVTDFVSWFIPRETAERYVGDARGYYDLYASTKTLIESGDYEQAVENVIYNESTEKIISLFADSEDTAELMAIADEAYNIYKTSSRFIIDGYYEDAVEYFIYDDKVSDFFCRFIPVEYVDECAAAADELYGLYKESKPLVMEGDYIAAVECIVESEKTESFLNRILPQEVFDGYNSFMIELDNAMESIDMETVNAYADWIREYCFVEAENIREYTAEEIQKINTEDLEEVFTYLENDKGKAGEYINSIDPVYYSNFKESLKDATWLRDTVRDYVDSMDFSTAKDYAYMVDEVRDLVSLLHAKDYLGAFKSAAGTWIPGMTGF